MSVGAAVVGDLYALEERGQAMGIFYGVGYLPPLFMLISLNYPLDRQSSLAPRLHHSWAEQPSTSLRGACCMPSLPFSLSSCSLSCTSSYQRQRILENVVRIVCSAWASGIGSGSTRSQASPY